MNARIWATGLLAVGGLFLGGAARAGDTVKLTLPARDDAPAVVLGKVGTDAETIDARFYGGRGGFYGGYRGYYGGYRGYYGGYRGYYGGYRGYYGYSYYSPYVYSYYTPYIYSASYYYTPRVYYYPAPVYCPISEQVGRVMPSADVMNTVPAPADVLPSPRPAPEGRTFPYDGGPRPEGPRIEPAPIRLPPPAVVPSPTVPLEGRPVSLPAVVKTPAKFAYPAYGELPRTTQFAEGRVIPVKK